MLLRYAANNHLSICDSQELSLAASKLTDKGSVLTVSSKSLRKDFLPVIALYGANAAGKSNMIYALRFLVTCVEDSYSTWPKRKRLPHQPCTLTGHGGKKPSSYDCDILVDDIRYHYGFSLDSKSVKSEWLYSYPNGVRKVLFHRDFDLTEDESIYIGPSLRGIDTTLGDLSKNRNHLFLSVFGSIEHSQLSPIFRFFSEQLVFVNSDRLQFVSDEQIADEISDPEMKLAVESFLRKADFGIVGLEIKRTPITPEQRDFSEGLANLMKKYSSSGDGPDMDFSEDSISIEYVHELEGGERVNLPGNMESTGTRHLLSLIAPTLNALREGKVLVVDEITTTLHTKLSEEIVGLFSSTSTNPNRAQFLFSTHDTNLLSADVLRRDEIWFAEKNRTGATHIYPLTDFQTRKSESLEKGYLQGRFGAVPYFGDFSKVLLDTNNEKKISEGTHA